MQRPRPSHALLLGAILALPPALRAEPAAEPPAAQQPAAGQRDALTERSQEQELILRHRLPASEQRELQAAEDVFLGLWLPALSEPTQGTVVLVADYGQHANHPNAIGPLRNRLPEAGWNSLSIGLPDALDVSARSPTPPATASESTAQAEAAEQSAPAEPAAPPQRMPVEQSQMGQPANAPAAEPQAPATNDPQATEQAHAERIFARIDAAVAAARAEQSAQIVLAGTGTGAYWAARYASERPASGIQRLALISLREPTARTLAQPPTVLPDMPVADIFYRNRSDEQSAARQRQLASQRLKRQHYQAISLQALPADREAEREQLYRRLRGWLSPLAP